MAVSSGRFEFALERLKPSDWERFEQLCSVFLANEFTGLRTMASAGGDRGRDAELYNFSDEPNVLFQYSVTEKWRPKIKATLDRLETEFPNVKHITFLSSQRIGASGDEVRQDAKKRKVSLDIRDRNWFVERVNLSESRQQAAYEISRVIVDPILEDKNVIASDKDLHGRELKIALTFLELQAQDDDASKGLTKSCFETLVRAALAGSSAANLVTRVSIHERVQSFLPQHSADQLKQFIDAALSRLAKKALKHHANQDSFHISHDEQESIKNRLAELELLKSEFYEDISDISIVALSEDTALIPDAKKYCNKVIEQYFYKLGEEFAEAVAIDRVPPVQEDILRTVCEEVAPNGFIITNLSWIDFLHSVSSSLLANASPKTVKYLKLLSSAYTLFAFLQSTPDVQKVTKKLFDQGSLWFDTTVLLPLFAERAYPEDMRPFTDLMVQLKRSGLQLFVTSGVIEEIERHLNLCKIYLKTKPWKGRVPYVYQRYALAGRSAGQFESWLDQFMGNFLPHDDLGDFLADTAGILLADAPDSDKIPRDVIEEINNYWVDVQDVRRGTQDTFSITANRLAAHDAENYIAVLSQRHRESGKSMLGYTSWLVTLDSAAWRLIEKVGETTRAFIKHGPVISLDFLIRYLSFGPRRDRQEPSDRGHAQIFSVAIFESVSPELIEAAQEVRKSYGAMEERQLQRRIRDGLNKQKLQSGVLQEAGLEGMEKALQSLF